ncbi:MAG TPA: hypothetical protein P5137_00740 [Candidatus Brocadiia bacterium]|nr:hypothetical protein [Candidatus Brocadiia bacterium]
MRDLIELLALMALLVLGNHALDPRRRTAGDMLRAFGAWVVFFGTMSVLMFFPPLVVWILRAAVAVIVYYALKWVWDCALNLFRGPSLIPRLKRSQTSAMAAEALANGGEEDARSRVWRRDVARLARRFCAADLLRAVMKARGRGDAGASALPGLAAEEAAETDRMAAECFRIHEGSPSRWDRAFVAEALLVYDAASVSKVLSRREPALGGKARRLAAAEWLEKEGRPAPWTETLEELGLRPASRREPAEGKRPCASLTQRVAAVLCPPAACAWAGFKGRALLLAGVYVALLGYALVSLLQDRAGGWIFLAVWGLLQLLGMFAVSDLFHDRAEDATPRPL